MQQYSTLVQNIIGSGTLREDRTGVGTRSLFGPQMEFDLQAGFPLVTMKKTNFRAIVIELLWMLSGSTNVQPLQDQGVHIWDEWANEDGELGPIYGHQWRSWTTGDPAAPYVDQIQKVIDDLNSDPFSRRHVVSAWNVADLPFMALAPCHTMFQFYVREQGDTRYLDCKLYQRSGDVFLGVPFNIASYALLTVIVARLTDCVPGRFIHTFGDVHLYSNHHSGAMTMLLREPRRLPRLYLSDFDSLDELTLGHFTLSDYNPHPAIPAPVAV